MDVSRLRELTHDKFFKLPSLFGSRNGRFPVKGIDTFIGILRHFRRSVSRNGRFPFKGIDTVEMELEKIYDNAVEMDVSRLRELTHLKCFKNVI